MNKVSKERADELFMLVAHAKTRAFRYADKRDILFVINGYKELIERYADNGPVPEQDEEEQGCPIDFAPYKKSRYADNGPGELGKNIGGQNGASCPPPRHDSPGPLVDSLHAEVKRTSESCGVPTSALGLPGPSPAEVEAAFDVIEGADWALVNHKPGQAVAVAEALATVRAAIKPRTVTRRDIEDYYHRLLDAGVIEDVDDPDGFKAELCAMLRELGITVDGGLCLKCAEKRILQDLRSRRGKPKVICDYCGNLADEDAGSCGYCHNLIPRPSPMARGRR